MAGKWLKEHAHFACIALASAGISYGFYHREEAVRKLCSRRLTGCLKKTEREIHIVTNSEEWLQIFPAFSRQVKSDGAVGFDCEWVHVKNQRRPVALLQLASSFGMCVLIRLSQMKDDIPETLKEFLEDGSLLKVGVDSLKDGYHLAADYGLMVHGCVDLRHLALQDQQAGDEGKASPKKQLNGLGLNALTEMYLDRSLDKSWRVRASDWEAEKLTQRQIRYAAEDALSGIRILIKILDCYWQPSSLTLYIAPEAYWYQEVQSALQRMCHQWIDRKFTDVKADFAPSVGKGSGQPSVPAKMKKIKDGFSACKGPHYYNSLLYAPDDQLLCTCDSKKALWYVAKGLGEIVSEDPLTVRLKFEPTGRPQYQEGDGEFYLQERLNKCVVCGKEEKLMKKNVVPHEYRKHFPDILKTHQSHDVILLCSDCFQTSNSEDDLLRAQLAEECDAPIGIEHDNQVQVERECKLVRNAGRTLLKSRDTLPEERVKALEKIIMKYYEVDFITKDHLEQATNMKVKVSNDKYRIHGQKVYERYEKTGVMKLEQRWRKHFLESMKPQHLPKCWSVMHNMFKMRQKMSFLPLDHPDRMKFQIALVGSEGHIEVPYMPPPARQSLGDFSFEENGDRLTFEA
ncbi:exonuclease 3'-5' domain-containing protein 2-like [Penaeus monodon]|uniref:exonuclease 3'-5' domain-containing protein 2-like n=1 Tax=Penaeus monodon TaxID=6687 RepID=UPI0018A77FA0|nr:exonuclease 3'-5' domain-containing protein 2-like [Penaeus monodon]